MFIKGVRVGAGQYVRLLSEDGKRFEGTVLYFWYGELGNPVMELDLGDRTFSMPLYGIRSVVVVSLPNAGNPVVSNKCKAPEP